MRSYNQLCPVAKALDTVGERWNLLIVRELLIRGSCRYTDLMEGVPGISTSVLAERLASLESGGVVMQRLAPPPIATTLYELTAAGRELEEVVVSLGQWGLKYGKPPDDHDRGRPHWLPFVLSLKLRDGPSENPAIICVESPGDRFLLQIAGRRMVIVHDALEPDVTLNGAKDLLYRFLSGQITEDQAAAGGMTIQGDASVLARLDSSLSGGTPVGSPAA